MLLLFAYLQLSGPYAFWPGPALLGSVSDKMRRNLKDWNTLNSKRAKGKFLSFKIQGNQSECPECILFFFSKKCRKTKFNGI